MATWLTQSAGALYEVGRQIGELHAKFADGIPTESLMQMEIFTEEALMMAACAQKVARDGGFPLLIDTELMILAVAAGVEAPIADHANRLSTWGKRRPKIDVILDTLFKPGP